MTTLHLIQVLGFVYAISTAPFALLASEKTLPKGNPRSAPGAKLKISEEALKAPVPVEQPSEVSVSDGSCFRYHVDPVGGSVYPERDGSLVYVLAKLPDFAKAEDSKFQLLTVDMTDLSAAPLMALKVKKKSAIIGHSNPVSGFSVVTYQGTDDGCYEGQASVVTIPRPKDGVAAAHALQIGQPVPVGHYKLVGGSRGGVLADMKAHRIVEVDPATLQKRVGPKFAENQIPLFYDVSKQDLYLFNTDASGTLSRYSLSVGKEEARIQLASGYKLFQDHHRFGVVGIDSKANELKIRELKTWTGEHNAVFPLKLPSRYPVTEARVVLDTEMRRVVVLGDTIAARKRWSNALIFDYGTGKSLGPIKVPKEHYVADAVITGQYGLFVINKLDDTFAGLATFSFKDQKWQRVKIAKF